MNWACLCLAVGLALAAGCTTRSHARKEAQAAYLAGQRDAMRAMDQASRPQVLFQGQFQNKSVPWVDGLTLSEAISAAQYTGRISPIEIVVVRNGQPHRIQADLVFRGKDNPVLAPGDLVQILR